MATAPIALTPPENELSRVMYISCRAISERFRQRKLFSILRTTTSHSCMSLYGVPIQCTWPIHSQLGGIPTRYL